MKTTTLSLCLVCVALAPLQAQVFRPEAVNGAVLGGIAGAVIGNNSGDLRHNAWKGAAIGAGAGLILGQAVGDANAAARGPQGPVARGGGYVYRDAPSVRVNVGYGYGRGAVYGHYGYRGHDYGRDYGRFYRGSGYGGYYYAPSFGYYSGYGDGYPYYDTGYYGSGSGAANGLVLGALAGGIIGNNSGEFRHNGWRGAAWGAGLGWLLGSVADANRRAVVYERAPVVVPAASAVPTQPAAQAATQPITIINNYYNSPSPMSGANSLFGR
jgi:hypothetical protein